MSETVINLFLDILAAVYTNFAILYFSRQLLPVRNKISLFFLLILFTLPMSLCFLMKRSTLSGEFTILIQLLILGCVFIGFHASFLQKLAVYFIFVLLETCAEIVASSVFLHRVPDVVDILPCYIRHFFVGQRPAIKCFGETRSQLQHGAVPGDWGPSTNKQFCGAKSQSVYHSALLASFV